MSFMHWLDPALNLVRDHHGWAGPVCFGLAFAESLLLVSFLVPATVMLIAIGGLVPLTDMSFAEIWVGSACGAVAGDWLSYWVGLRFEDRIGSIWPLSRYPQALGHGRRFFERWGAFGVFFGRFSGPLRATVPLAAGMCAMPLLHFQAANITSAFLWAFVVLAPGAFGVTWLRSVFG